MSVYSLETVLKKWKHGELTADQAIGQILQHLHGLADRIGKIERRQQGYERPPSKPPRTP